MVIHILKDGSKVQDINGHIVRVEEVKSVYNLIDSINRDRLRRTKESGVMA